MNNPSIQYPADCITPRSSSVVKLIRELPRTWSYRKRAHRKSGCKLEPRLRHKSPISRQHYKTRLAPNNSTPLTNEGLRRRPFSTFATLAYMFVSHNASKAVKIRSINSEVCTTCRFRKTKTKKQHSSFQNQAMARVRTPRNAAQRPFNFGESAFRVPLTKLSLCVTAIHSIQLQADSAVGARRPPAQSTASLSSSPDSTLCAYRYGRKT